MTTIWEDTPKDGNPKHRLVFEVEITRTEGYEPSLPTRATVTADLTDDRFYGDDDDDTEDSALDPVAYLASMSRGPYGAANLFEEWGFEPVFRAVSLRYEPLGQ